MQKAKKRTGLPDELRMRHDDHFVELISSRTTGPRIRMIQTKIIDPSTYQARSELGNIEELMASIKAKGILEPILVRPKGVRYEIIAGERRWYAAKNIGLEEIPCIEMNVKDNEAMELALIENLQRKDLDVFEEAEGLNALIDIYGYSHSQLSGKIGKARSTITEILNISRIPIELRKLCKEKKITSRSTIIEIAKQKNEDDMKRLINQIRDRDLTREDTRELSKRIKGKIKGEKHFVFNYMPKADFFKLRIEFKKQKVTKEEIIRILEEVINKMKSKGNIK